MTSPNVTQRNYPAVALTIIAMFVLIAGCDTGVCDANCLPDISGDFDVSIISHERSFPANLEVVFKVEAPGSGVVGDLDSSNFQIFDNETLQSQFESSSKINGQEGDFKTSVVLVLDLSGSITTTENLAPLKSASIAFLQSALAIGQTEVGVWWFDGEAALKELVEFTTDEATLTAAIDALDGSISTDASTNLYGAVEQSVGVIEARLDQIDDNVVSIGAIAIFTDGTDQASRSTASNALSAVNNADPKVNLYSIGLRGEIDEDFLKNVGKNGWGFAANINEITPEFTKIAEKIRDQANSIYQLDYCSPRRSGLNHTLKISVQVGSRSGTAELDYSAEGFSGGCTVD